jgi:ribosomal protein S18 acetylase RimI-like enzyme
MKTDIVLVEDREQLKKEFIPILSYWNKQGLVRFVPFFALYRALDNRELYMLKVNNRGSGANWETVGILWLVQRKRPTLFFQINVFALDQRYLNMGFGSEILEFLCQRLIDNFGQEIELSVEKNNEAAIQFYLKNGFRIIERNESKSGVKTYRMRHRPE